jgi:two-component system sensor kinase FixL
MSDIKATTIVLIAGFLVGLFFVHPLTMVIQEFFHWHQGYWHLHWYEIPNALRAAYSIQHLPNAVVYGILTSFVAYFWASSNIKYRQIASLSQRFALIGRESATIIHDINNPLFGIRAFTEFIKEGLEDSERLDYCERVKSSADRISGLVAEIKTLAAGDGTINVKKEPILLDEMASNVAKELHIRARLEIDQSAHREIQIDPVYFSRVLSNLLKNADDAMKDRSNAVIEISLTVNVKKDLIVEISDNGRGIPKEIRKNLFRFGVTYGKIHGTGIGLYTARRIVEAHGGFITFKDRSGGGTVFVIELPGE